MCRGKFPTMYSPPDYKAWMAEVVKQLKARPYSCGGDDVSVSMIVMVSRPKTTKRKRPAGDADNYAKATLDAATYAGLWDDDVQIVDLTVWKRWATAAHPPCVYLHVTHQDPSLTPQVPDDARLPTAENTA